MSGEVSDDFTPFARVLPEGAMPMFGFTIAVYMTPDGEEIHDRYEIVGRCTLRDALGTLEVVKARLIRDTFGGLEDGDSG